MNCKYFAATEGSISHNVIFCQPNTEAIILLKAKYRNGYQPSMNEAANINATYIDVHHTPNYREPWHGPFFMCLTPELKRFFNITSVNYPYFLKTNYFKVVFNGKIKPEIYGLYSRLKRITQKTNKIYTT